MKNWIAASQRYIGKPWSVDGFACYDFVRAMYQDVTGIALPFIPRGSDYTTSMRILALARNDNKNWIQIPQAEPGCIVTMSQANTPHHCGIYVGQQFIAHVYESKSGVTLSKPAHLAAQSWKICGYYRFCDAV